MKEIKLKNGVLVNQLGLGTWFLGEDENSIDSDLQALQTGIDLGVNLIDTAEIYGDGKAEMLVSKLLENNKRKDLFIVSKIRPEHTTEELIYQHLEASLKRLNTDYLDLYLLHRRFDADLEFVVKTFEKIKAAGKIKAWGVSNFDVKDMQDLLAIKNGDQCLVNQVLYHLGSRGIEYELIPLLKKHDIKVMAYSPLAHNQEIRNKLITNETMIELANKYQITPLQLLLAFVLHHQDMLVVARSSQAKHVKDLVETTKVKLSEKDFQIISDLFKAPNHKVDLDII